MEFEWCTIINLAFIRLLTNINTGVSSTADVIPALVFNTQKVIMYQVFTVHFSIFTEYIFFQISLSQSDEERKHCLSHLMRWNRQVCSLHESQLSNLGCFVCHNCWKFYVHTLVLDPSFSSVTPVNVCYCFVDRFSTLYYGLHVGWEQSQEKWPHFAQLDFYQPAVFEFLLHNVAGGNQLFCIEASYSVLALVYRHFKKPLRFSVPQIKPMDKWSSFPPPRTPHMNRLQPFECWKLKGSSIFEVWMHYSCALLYLLSVLQLFLFLFGGEINIY